MYKYINFDYILSNFGIRNYKIDKIKEKKSKKPRSIYKIYYFDNLYCLKQTYFNIQKMLFIYSYLNWLNNYNVPIPNLIKSHNNKPFVVYDNTCYILTRWIKGEKLNYDNLDECIKTMQFLGKMHSISSNMNPIEKSKPSINFVNLRHKLTKQINELNKIHNLAYITQDDFSKKFIAYYKNFLYLGEKSVKVASIINTSKLNISICHGDFVSKNIIINNSVVPIDFDRCCISYSIFDLAFFLKRYLRHKGTYWNFENALILINSYNKKNSISIDEYLYLIAYLSFPYKFLKLSKLYFNNLYNLSNNNKYEYQNSIKKIGNSFEHQFKFILSFEKYFNSKFHILI